MATALPALAEPQWPRETPLVFRELLPEEYGRLAAVEGFKEFGVPPPAHTRIVVAEDQTTKAIVGYWMVFEAVHVEPLWIHESFRRRRSVGFRLWGEVKKILGEISNRYAVGTAYAHILDDNPLGRELAARIGFKRVPGDLYYVNIQALKPVPVDES